MSVPALLPAVAPTKVLFERDVNLMQLLSACHGSRFNSRGHLQLMCDNETLQSFGAPNCFFFLPWITCINYLLFFCCNTSRPVFLPVKTMVEFLLFFCCITSTPAFLPVKPRLNFVALVTCLDCYWVGSLDFNCCEGKGFPTKPTTSWLLGHILHFCLLWFSC